METKSTYNEARKRAIYNHKQKIDEIRLSVPKGKKAKYVEAATQEGKSLNRFIIDAVEEHLEQSDKSF